MTKNGIEIFFQNLGDADSIFVRHWKNDTPTHILIDGGHKKDYADIKPFLLERFKESKHYQIDHLVCSHCHDDHAGGLVELAKDNEMTIATAWVHDTREKNLLNFSRTKALISAEANTLLEKATASEKRRHELINALEENHPNIVINEPYADGDTWIGPLKVISPTREFFNEQYSRLDDQSKIATIEESLVKQAQEISATEAESKPLGATVGPENEVSTVLAYPREQNGSNYIYVFTADAGCEAFSDIIERYPTALQGLRWMQIPHHGSRRNLTEDLIAHFAPQSSFISCIGNNKHPSIKLVNKLKEHGKVFSTHYSVNKSSWLRHNAGDVYEMATTTATPLYEKE